MYINVHGVLVLGIFLLSLGAWPSSANEEVVATQRVMFPSEIVPEARRNSAEASANSNSKITGGYFVAPGELTFQVALIEGGTLHGEELYGQFCGGSLIAPGWVLTAAHCVTIGEGDFYDPMFPEDVEVYYGSVFLDADGQRVAVTDIFIHDSYDPMSTNSDIALLKLASPVKSEKVSIISLPDTSVSSNKAEEILAEGSLVTVSGWGKTEAGDFPNQLKAVEVELQSQKLCNSNIVNAQLENSRWELRLMFSRLGITPDAQERIINELKNGTVVTEAMLCAGLPQGSKDSCQGDSGGPLFSITPQGGYEQFGIVSWGVSCGEPELFGVYTDVLEFTDWINARIK